MAASTGLLALLLLWLASGEPMTAEAAFSWLMRNGLWKALEAILKPVLGDLWVNAWAAGLEAAESLSGPSGDIPGIPSGEQFPDSTGRTWLNQIVRHRLEAIARVLADSDGNSERLAGQLRALLADANWAQLVAETETTRAMQEASRYVYRHNGVHMVRWVIADAHACPACQMNAAAGPHPSGTPFPSGAVAPPEHPRCRCALIPALWSRLTDINLTIRVLADGNIAERQWDGTGIAGILVKAVEEKRYTLAVAYPANRPDAGVARDGHRDFASADAIEEAAHNFMLKSQNIGAWHADGTDGAGRVVESYIYRGPDWAVTAADNSTHVIKAGDWLLGVRWDEPTWALIKSGQIGGISPQGTAQRRIPDAATLAGLRS